MLVVGLCTTGASLARADKPLIAVLPFNGPQSKKAEAVVVRALRKKAVLVPFSHWQASAKKLFAPSHSPDDIQSVAQDLGAKIVITGVVKRDGRSWQLAVSVRDGETGRSRDKLKYPLKGPRIESHTLELLGNEVSAAFQHALDATGSDESSDEEEAPKKPPKKPPVVAEKPPVEKSTPKVQPIDEEVERPPPKPAPIEKDETPPGIAATPGSEPEKRPAATVTAAAGDRRPRWAPYFDLSVGASISGRSFDFTPASLPRFSSGVVGGIHADLTFYPLAGTWRAAHGVFAGLGIGATLDYPVWPPSKGPDANKYDTQELNVRGGLRWHIPLYKPIPRPELLIVAGGGFHSFSIAKKIDMATGALSDVGPPDMGLGFLGVGVGLRLHFAEWARIWFLFQYHAVLASGAVTTGDEYGPASVFGVRPEGGLDFFVYKGLKISLAGHYERYQLTFIGSNPPPLKPGNGQLADSGVDQYFGGTVSLGYEF